MKDRRYERSFVFWSSSRRQKTSRSRRKGRTVKGQPSTPSSIKKTCPCCGPFFRCLLSAFVVFFSSFFHSLSPFLLFLLGCVRSFCPLPLFASSSSASSVLLVFLFLLRDQSLFHLITFLPTSTPPCLCSSLVVVCRNERDGKTRTLAS